MNNYAFIDGNNLHLGTTRVDGWKINYRKFREYLFKRYSITKAYYFMGFIPQESNFNLYHSLIRAGFILKFKRTKTNNSGEIKGNIDIELVLNTILRKNKFDKAIIVAGDDDYYCFLRYLYKNNKLLRVITPNNSRCPRLFKTSFINNLKFAISDLREKIKYEDLP